MTLSLLVVTSTLSLGQGPADRVQCALERDLLDAGHKLEQKWVQCEQLRKADQELIKALTTQTSGPTPEPREYTLDLLGIPPVYIIIGSFVVGAVIGGGVVWIAK